MLKFKRLFRSFKFAFRGLAFLFKKEQNFRVHFAIALIVIILGLYFQIKIWQWCLIILLVTLIFILEILNTAFERMADMLKPRWHDYVAEIKDIMSSAVLVTAIASALIGLLIFVPYLLP